MKQLKKTLLTLVALLAVTTGAWADDTYTIKFEANGNSKTVENVTLPHTFSCDYSGENGELDQIIKQLYGLSGGCCSMNSPGASGNSNVTAGVNGDNQFITISAPFEGNATVTGSYFDAAMGYSDFDYSLTISCPGYDPNAGSSTPAASSGPEVAWNKAKNSGSFKMPGGNVTLEPEYYPQAALTAAPTAINDVPATTDGAIVSAGTVANIGETTTAQGTVMYYVSQTEMTDAALLALAADQWTADVPTAADLAQGPAYVYYYVRGNDSDTDDENFSDGDILAANKVAVTIAAEPTYAVTFAEGTEESDKWTASPAADVKKGQTVTVTYTGSKKVIGVKAEKKAAVAPSVSFTVKRVDHKRADGNYTVAPGTTWQQFIESGDAPACLSIGTSGMYSGKVCHDMDGGVTCCGGTLIANVADKKRVKASDAIIDGATYGCSDYLDYQDHD